MKTGFAPALVDAIARRLFSHRRVWLLGFALLTALLGGAATQLKVDAGFAKTIPSAHPFMTVFGAYRGSFGSANRLSVALVRRDGGDLFNAADLAALKALSDEVFFLAGVDRPSVASLFTPNTRYVEVVDDGFAGGNVVPANFGYTAAEIARVKTNLQKSAEFGRLVATDFSGALVRAELLEVDPASGRRLDYQALGQALEALRLKYETPQYRLHVIGFAQVVNDIAAGARTCLGFFAIAALLTLCLLRWYTRSWRQAAVTAGCAALPVLWLLGTLPLLGFGLDPLSMLVPFLIFAIGVSHAVQMARAWADACQAGQAPPAAAASAFRQLFVPGSLALLTNALGFLVIMLIDIPIVRELGITASLGVALMIITNKLLLPIVLAALPPGAAGPRAPRHPAVSRFAGLGALLARRGPAALALAATLPLLLGGLWQARQLITGDLGDGIPELRADARYNQDVRAVAQRFTIGVDVLSVVAQSQGVDSACTDPAIMAAVDRFSSDLANLPGVRQIASLSETAKAINAGLNEGHVKWRALPPTSAGLAQAVAPVETASGLINADCSALQLLAFPENHHGPDVTRLLAAVTELAARHRLPQLEFRLAGGNIGVIAATNEAVDAAEWKMLAAMFGALGLLCLLAFRSVAAVLCILLPLALVSVLGNALMALLGIGLKVSTLPVIAFGVGVGVDYGIYLYAVVQARLQAGARIDQACADALQQRGGTAVFTATTLALGVGAWAFSPLKLQADMGVLLAFLFLVNVLGAVLLLPALAAWLHPRHANTSVTLNPLGVR